MSDIDRDLVEFNDYVKKIVKDNDGVPIFDTEQARSIYERFRELPYETKMTLLYRGLGCQSREDKSGNTVCPVFIKHNKGKLGAPGLPPPPPPGRTIVEGVESPPTKLSSEEEIELLKTRFWLFRTIFMLVAIAFFMFSTVLMFFFLKISTENADLMDGLSKIFKIVIQ